MASNDPLFKSKYRSKSNRLQDWDYADAACYFVTLCTKKREPFFGEIIDDEVWLSPLGEIIDEELKRTGSIRPNVSIDEFVIMPNHFHAIIHLQTDPHMKTDSVETHSCASLQGPLLRRAPRSLGSIIAGFKSAATKRIRSGGRHDFAWQRGYYDHVIRDDDDLRRIRRYIQLNPLQWSLDRYHPSNHP